VVSFDVKTTQITHIPIIVLFHPIGLEGALCRTSGCLGNGTNATTISTTLNGQVISKCGAATTAPVVVVPVLATTGALSSASPLLIPLLVPPLLILCMQEDLGWRVDGRVALETQANAPVWLAELGKTTSPSAARAEQYDGTEIADLPQLY
jgi:hypothetical protein